MAALGNTETGGDAWYRGDADTALPASAHCKRSCGYPSQFCPWNQNWERPSVQREALGMDLFPDGRGWVCCCSEQLAVDSHVPVHLPQSTWLVDGHPSLLQFRVISALATGYSY